MTRDVYYGYMLSSIGFGNNLAWSDVDLDDANEVGHARAVSLGWIGWVPNPDGLSNYSGWAVDLLALAVERLAGTGGRDSETGREYAGYLETVRRLVLDPLQMRYSDGAFTRRPCPHRYQVTFVGGSYLEQVSPALGSNPFAETVLFDAKYTEGVDDVYADGDLPPDAYLSPAFVTGPYGGRNAGGFRLEAVVAAGGWVSTAVDLARFSSVLEDNNPVLDSQWVQVARSLEYGKGLTDGGWGPAGATAPFAYLGSTLSSAGYISFREDRGRHLSAVSTPQASISTLMSTITNWLSSIGY